MKLLRDPSAELAKRRDPSALLAKLLMDRQCRACGREATDPHHIVTRGGKLGDDVIENIMPLCRACHDKFHAEGKLAAPLSWEEVAYTQTKLGPAALDYMERRYCWRTD